MCIRDRVGIPFSDPLADGPVIQSAGTMALKNGMTVKKLFAQLKDATEYNATTLTIVVVELLQNIIVLTLLHSITGNDTSLIACIFIFVQTDALLSTIPCLP